MSGFAGSIHPSIPPFFLMIAISTKIANAAQNSLTIMDLQCSGAIDRFVDAAYQTSGCAFGQIDSGQVVDALGVSVS